jgi:hypothetical protein
MSNNNNVTELLSITTELLWMIIDNSTSAVMNSKMFKIQPIVLHILYRVFPLKLALKARL